MKSIKNNIVTILLLLTTFASFGQKKYTYECIGCDVAEKADCKDCGGKIVTSTFSGIRVKKGKRVIKELHFPFEVHRTGSKVCIEELADDRETYCLGKEQTDFQTTRMFFDSLLNCQKSIINGAMESGGGLENETITTLIDNGNGTYTYTSEDGTVTVINNTQSTVSSTDGSVNVTTTSNPDGTINYDLDVDLFNTDTTGLKQLITGCIPNFDSDLDTVVNNLAINITDNNIQVSVSNTAGQTFSDDFDLVWNSGIIDTTGLKSFIEDCISAVGSNTVTSTDGVIIINTTTNPDGSLNYDLNIDLADSLFTEVDTTGLKLVIQECITDQVGEQAIDISYNSINNTITWSNEFGIQETFNLTNSSTTTNATGQGMVHSDGLGNTYNYSIDTMDNGSGNPNTLEFNFNGTSFSFPYCPDCGDTSKDVYAFDTTTYADSVCLTINGIIESCFAFAEGNTSSFTDNNPTTGVSSTHDDGKGNTYVIGVDTTQNSDGTITITHSLGGDSFSYNSCANCPELDSLHSNVQYLRNANGDTIGFTITQTNIDGTTSNVSIDLPEQEEIIWTVVDSTQTTTKTNDTIYVENCHTTSNGTQTLTDCFTTSYYHNTDTIYTENSFGLVFTTAINGVECKDTSFFEVTSCEVLDNCVPANISGVVEQPDASTGVAEITFEIDKGFSATDVPCGECIVGNVYLRTFNSAPFLYETIENLTCGDQSSATTSLGAVDDQSILFHMVGNFEDGGNIMFDKKAFADSTGFNGVNAMWIAIEWVVGGSCSLNNDPQCGVSEKWESEWCIINHLTFDNSSLQSDIYDTTANNKYLINSLAVGSIIEIDSCASALSTTCGGIVLPLTGANDATITEVTIGGVSYPLGTDGYSQNINGSILPGWNGLFSNTLVMEPYNYFNYNVIINPEFGEIYDQCTERIFSYGGFVHCLDVAPLETFEICYTGDSDPAQEGCCFKVQVNQYPPFNY